jgi:hypothetical protein
MSAKPDRATLVLSKDGRNYLCTCGHLADEHTLATDFQSGELVIYLLDCNHGDNSYIPAVLSNLFPRSDDPKCNCLAFSIGAPIGKGQESEWAEAENALLMENSETGTVN